MEVKVRYVRQSSSYDHYAVITLQAEVAAFFEVVNQANLEQYLFDGLVDGLRRGLDGAPYRIILTDAKTHPVDSGPRSFRRAGLEAAEKILQEKNA